MNRILYILFLSVLLLTGCYITPEKVIYREEYFQPMSVSPQRKVVTISYEEMVRLKKQLDSVFLIVSMLKDSIEFLKCYSNEIIASAKSLKIKSDVVVEDKKIYYHSDGSGDIERKIAELKLDNKRLSEQLDQLQAKLISGVSNANTYESKEAITSKVDSYKDALLKFYGKRYNESKFLFQTLLENGIDEELRDNCEYWIGECYFAMHQYEIAIRQFQKVLNIASSNKMIDAYFMIGRSYEGIGNLELAKKSYLELNNKYPYNHHYNRAIDRIQIINRKLGSSKDQVRNRSKV